MWRASPAVLFGIIFPQSGRRYIIHAYGAACTTNGTGGRQARHYNGFNGPVQETAAGWLKSGIRRILNQRFQPPDPLLQPRRRFLVPLGNWRTAHRYRLLVAYQNHLFPAPCGRKYIEIYRHMNSRFRLGTAQRCWTLDIVPKNRDGFYAASSSWRCQYLCRPRPVCR